MRCVRCWLGWPSTLRSGAKAPEASGAVRGSASLYAGRPEDGLRADAARALAHRQGRPQIRLLSGRRDAAPRRTRPDHLSQCSTVFAMRLANERDQEIIRSAIADSSASTLSFLSSMGQREAIAFGEGVATTMPEVREAAAEPPARRSQEGRRGDVEPGRHRPRIDRGQAAQRVLATAGRKPCLRQPIPQRGQAGDPDFRPMRAPETVFNFRG